MYAIEKVLKNITLFADLNFDIHLSSNFEENMNFSRPIKRI